MLKLKALLAKVVDSLTIKTGTITYTDARSYGGDWAPVLKKCGKVVWFSGAFSPKAQVAANATLNCCTIPKGFRPAGRTLVLCQGSTFNIWCLDVFTNGTVQASRYRAGSTANTIDVGNWLVFNATWITND